VLFALQRVQEVLDSKFLDLRCESFSHSQGALKGRGIDRMLDEAREDNKENDVANMKRKCELMQKQPMEMVTNGTQDEPRSHSSEELHCMELRRSDLRGCIFSSGLVIFMALHIVISIHRK